MSTPPSLPTSGNTWPGRTKSLAPLFGLASARTVLLRSSAEMPVVRPWRTSTDTGKAVPSGASLSATMGSRCRRLASSEASGAHTMPEVLRMMNAIFSGVQSEAATNRSPSFSRSSSSVTTTISPLANDATTDSTRLWVSASTVLSTSRPLEGPFRALAHLGALTQIMVGNPARHHGLADRHRPDADARIVPSLGADLGLVAEAVHGAPRREDRRGRLDREAHHHRLASRNSSEDAAGVVREEHRLAVVAHPPLVP